VKGCPHCGKAVFRASADGRKLKAKTRILVLHKATGEAEINCGNCGKGVIIPLVLAEGTVELRKGEPPRLVARKA
jgi:ribosomal protein S27AE